MQYFPTDFLWISYGFVGDILLRIEGASFHYGAPLSKYSASGGTPGGRDLKTNASIINPDKGTNKGFGLYGTSSEAP